MQLISNIRLSVPLINMHNNHIAITVEVKDNIITKYMVRISEPATSAHSNINILLTRLIGRLHSPKFCLSKSLTIPFVKILYHQTFAPYSTCLYGLNSCTQEFLVNA